MMVAPSLTQWAAVRIARGAMIVPEHDPIAPLASRVFIRTTGELAVEHSLPLMMEVVDGAPSPPHTLTDGVVGLGDGELGDPLPPPHATKMAPATASRPAVKLGRTRITCPLRDLLPAARCLLRAAVPAARCLLPAAVPAARCLLPAVHCPRSPPDAAAPCRSTAR